MDKSRSVPHQSTAARKRERDCGNNLAAYYDEAWCIDLCITEKDNNTPLTSFQHVTTAIVLAPTCEDLNTLRADIAAIYHAKLGDGNETGEDKILRPDQLPTLMLQHDSLGSRESQYLNSVSVKLVLSVARTWAKLTGKDNAILAVMPRTTP